MTTFSDWLILPNDLGQLAVALLPLRDGLIGRAVLPDLEVLLGWVVLPGLMVGRVVLLCFILFLNLVELIGVSAGASLDGHAHERTNIESCPRASLITHHMIS